MTVIKDHKDCPLTSVNLAEDSAAACSPSELNSRVKPRLTGDFVDPRIEYLRLTVIIMETRMKKPITPNAISRPVGNISIF